MKDSKLVNLVKQMPKDLGEIEKLSLFTENELKDSYNKKVFMIIKNFTLKSAKLKS